MKAMVLAAGFGERMRPLTEGRAKPSLPLVNRPIILQTLSYLKTQGVSEAMINLHHYPESIRGLVGDGSRIGMKVHYSEEQTILGTAGGLKKAEAYFRSAGTFIMTNSDFVTDCDLVAAVHEHQKSGAAATLILTPPRPGDDYGSVELDASGRVRSIAGRPGGRTVAAGIQISGSDWQADSSQPQPGYTFTGIHILEPIVLDAIPPGVRYEINREVYPVLMQQGVLIKGYVHHGFWREMGTPRLYLDGSMMVLAEGRDQTLESIRKDDGVYLEDVELPPGTTSGPPLLVGRGSSIGQRCSLIGGVVIGRHCRIGNDCALRSSILWDGARLADRVQLTDCIVTSGAYLPPRTTLSARIIFRVDGYQGKKDNLERVGACWASRLQ